MDSYWNFTNFGNDLFPAAAPVSSPLSQQGSVHSPWTVEQERNGGTNTPQIQGQQTLGDLTLDEFLVHVGVKGNNNTDSGFRDQSSSISANPNVSWGFGVEQKPTQHFQGPNLDSNVTKYQPQQPIMPKPNGYGYGTQIGFPSGPVNTHGDRILQENIPRVKPNHGLRTNNGVSSLVSPSPYTFGGGTSVRGRESYHSVAFEKKQRRKIKNREAAARSRARQLAQAMELDAEVEKLKKENQELLRKQEEMSEMLTKSAKGMRIYLKEGPERRLRRTQSDI